MPATDAQRRRQVAALAADESWAQTPDWSSRTAPAREARWKKYEHQVDPLKQLDPVTRAKRAEKAFTADQRRNSRKGVITQRRTTCHRLEGQLVEVVTETGETLRGVLMPLANDEVRLQVEESETGPMPLTRIAKIHKARVRRSQAQDPAA